MPERRDRTNGRQFKMKLLITNLILIGVLRTSSTLAIEPPAPAASAAQGLIQRLLPAGPASQFTVEQIEADGTNDVFEIESRAGRIILRGNNGVAIASALNRYLKDYCHCDISWNCGNQLVLPEALPQVPAKTRVTSPYRYRYAYNYCTHGYTMAWWDWPRWERELDYLALNGVNLALVIEGQESVWQNTLKQFGYSDDEIRQWLVMPSHQPWMYMANIEGYGGPVPQELIDRRKVLGQLIVKRMLDFGINPVLQGYYGIVPGNFGQRFPEAKCLPQGKWGDLKRPDMLEPGTPMFSRLAAAFYAQQAGLFGQAKYFAADPFHEGGSTDSIDLRACGHAIFNAMGNATWVKDRLLILDLHCEAQENWRARNSFNGTPWLWCAIQNFGGNVGLGGRLAWFGEGPAKALQDPSKGRLFGVGALMEGSQSNPVIWEMLFENAWRSSAPDLNVWLEDYTRRRYGTSSPAANRAWKTLVETAYGSPASNLEYPINSVVCARPTLKLDSRARAMVTTQANYKTEELARAWGSLLAAAPQTAASDGYQYDLVDVGREVLARLASDYQQHIISAYREKDAAALKQYGRKMLGLIQDMDRLTGTRRELLLGNWLAEARAWGQSTGECDLCERNARELLTIWTSAYNISDYANRQWNGLLGDYYHHRWKLWLAALQESLQSGVPIDEAAARQKIHDWEIQWTRKQNSFSAKPSGNSISISAELFKKYGANMVDRMAEQNASLAPARADFKNHTAVVSGN
jgi:alpha-N-acetylglucosaminidase